MLDVGCGSGLLSLLAVQAGARRVIGVSSSVNTARTAARTAAVSSNHVSDRLQFVEVSDLDSLSNERVGLADGSVDVIVSEVRHTRLLFPFPLFSNVCVCQCMSRCLLFNQLPTLVSARDRFLKRGGTMVPCRAVVQLTGCENSSLDSLNSVCGLDMSALSASLTSTSKLATCSATEVCLTSTQVLLDLDLLASDGQLHGEGPLELKVNQDGKLGAFLLSIQVMLGPGGSNPHSNSQSTLVINSGQDSVAAGTTITGSYALFRDIAAPSGEYTFSLTWNQSHQSFKITELRS